MIGANEHKWENHWSLVALICEFQEIKWAALGTLCAVLGSFLWKEY